jgi:D-alanyl-D-alanine carboxypeptidase
MAKGDRFVMRSKKYMNNHDSGIKMFIVAAVVVVISFYAASTKDKPVYTTLEVKASSAYLVDMQTGEVLFEQNADEPLPPASMSKLMTELLVLDAVNDGRLAWNEPVQTSAYAAAVPGSQIGFEQGETLTVRELFEAMAVHSANDAAVALAEHIGGSELEFVKRMQARAAQIGLSERTVFGNATGLSRFDLRPFKAAASVRDTLMTAKDTARLAAYMLKKYPEVLDVSSRGSIRLRGAAKALPATNLMLSGKAYAFPGNDGLKTGYTEQAGYCFTGTAKQDGRRLVSVIMGAKTADERFVETGKLFQYGFQNSHMEVVIGRLQSKLGIRV